MNVESAVPAADDFEEYTGSIVTVSGDRDAMLAGLLRAAARPDAVPPELALTIDVEEPAGAGDRLVDEGEIARGGMGSIRRVLDTAVLRHLAMKVLEGSDAGAQARSMRFLEEARISGQLEHPNIVPVHEVRLRPDGTPEFFTMKLAQGKTFRELIHQRVPGRRPTLALEQHVQIFLKVCDAVAFAHSRGVVHRDLKPANVMVGTHGQVYVMDWGLAMVLPFERLPESCDPAERVTLRLGSKAGNPDPEGTVAGTGAYMAPEQAWGRMDEIDVRSDVFGLGAMLYQVLTKSAPFPSNNAIDSILMAQKCEIEPPAVRVGTEVELPPELCRIAMRAMSVEREERYPDVDALKAEVEQALRGGLWLSTRVFEAGAMVVWEGEQGDAAYIIQEGTCHAFKTTNGRRTPLRSMGPGEVFGETAVFTAQPRTAGVEATTRLVVRVVTREALENELAASPSIAAFTRALAERFRDLDSRLARARDESFVDRHLRDCVYLEGKQIRRGVVEASWSRVRDRLCAGPKLSPDQISTAVARASDVVVDAASDTIIIASPMLD
jgi:serine/threonine-protein kinase